MAIPTHCNVFWERTSEYRTNDRWSYQPRVLTARKKFIGFGHVPKNRKKKGWNDMFIYKETYERGNLEEADCRFIDQICSQLDCGESYDICLSMTDTYLQKILVMGNGKILEIEIGLHLDELEWKCDCNELKKEKAISEVEYELSCYNNFQQARMEKGSGFKKEVESFLELLQEKESA
jgi:hypothetical protein